MHSSRQVKQKDSSPYYHEQSDRRSSVVNAHKAHNDIFGRSESLQQLASYCNPEIAASETHTSPVGSQRANEFYPGRNERNPEIQRRQTPRSASADLANKHRESQPHNLGKDQQSADPRINRRPVTPTTSSSRNTKDSIQTRYYGEQFRPSLRVIHRSDANDVITRALAPVSVKDYSAPSPSRNPIVPDSDRNEPQRHGIRTNLNSATFTLSENEWTFSARRNLGTSSGNFLAQSSSEPNNPSAGRVSLAPPTDEMSGILQYAHSGKLHQDGSDFSTSRVQARHDHEQRLRDYVIQHHQERRRKLQQSSA